MATITLEELMASPDEATQLQLQLDILAAAEFPVTSWEDDAIPLVQTRADVANWLLFAIDVPNVVKGGYLGLARGGWLTLLAAENFEEERGDADVAHRWLKLIDAGCGGDTFAAGSLIVRSSGDLLYRLEADAVLPDGGDVQALFVAFEPGAAYNGSSSSWELTTSVPGLDVEEGDGIETPGKDEQSDDALVTACRSKFATLGRGATDAAYLYLATHVPTIMDIVTRVRVLRHTPLPGQVTIVVAGPTAASPVTGADALDAGTIEVMQDDIDPDGHYGAKAPNCIDAFVESATYFEIALVGTVYALAGERAAAKVKAEASLNAYAATTPIAGKVSRERIITKIMQWLTDDDRNDLTLTTPAADIQLAAGKVPYFTFTGLVWTAV